MVQTGDLSLYEGKPYGNIMLRSNYSEMIRLSIHPGDSVNVHFSGGVVLEDIPFLSACILPEGMICLNAHEGFDWLRIEKRFGNAWALCGIRENETARIVLREAQKYAFLFRVFNTEFSLEREDYPNDERFTNYREVCCGHMRKGTFYRSMASFDPFNGKPEFRERQKYLDRLIERDGIEFIINMNCDRQQMKMLFDSGEYEDSYVQKLYKEGKVISDLFSIDFSGSVFRKQIATALRAMLKQAGPYLIQCKAGLDRTGFLCGLLEALAGADSSEITDDFMRSYDSLFGLTREKDREKYDVLRRWQADRIIDIIAGNEKRAERRFSYEELFMEQGAPVCAVDLCAAAEKYLYRCRLEQTEVDRLKKLLTE